MGLFPNFPICDEIINISQSFYSNVINHRITQKLIPYLLVVNHYIQTTYNYIRANTIELYYTYIDKNYESLSVYDFDKFGNEISCLCYSNHRYEQYLSLKSNTISFKNHMLQNEDTRNYIKEQMSLQNPMLSAIITIKSRDNDFETSLEVNKLLEPFLFSGNIIQGSPAFVFYLIHENIEYGFKNDNVNKNCFELCHALQNDKELSDYHIDMTYMSLNDVGIVTIPNIQERFWSISVTPNNDLILELNDNGEW